MNDLASMRVRIATALIAMLAAACGGHEAGGPSLARARSSSLAVGEARPGVAESAAVGEMGSRITRQSSRFGELVECRSKQIVFKNEEGTGADRLMTPRLRSRLYRLEERVTAQWSGVHVRVTEAWDEDGEHSGASLHYEGRAADLTTSDRDLQKLGRLGALAVEAGFDWVYRERTHIHASVRH